MTWFRARVRAEICCSGCTVRGDGVLEVNDWKVTRVVELPMRWVWDDGPRCFACRRKREKEGNDASES